MTFKEEKQMHINLIIDIKCTIVSEQVRKFDDFLPSPTRIRGGRNPFYHCVNSHI